MASQESLQGALQRLSGTTLDAQGACNVWINNPVPNPQLDLVGCLNTKAGLARADWLELEGILNRLAGTIGLSADGAAAAIGAGVANYLLTESGDTLITESGDTLVME